MYYSQREYRLLGFKRSQVKGKKYSASIQHKTTGKKRTINFGSTTKPNQQYRDSTGLGLYSHLDHGDKKRRTSYRARHSVYLRKGYYSPSYFSYTFLW